MATPIAVRAQTAWADFQTLTAAIRERLFALSSDYDIRFKGRVAYGPGIFEDDYSESERREQDRFVNLQRRHGATKAATYSQFIASLDLPGRDDVTQRVRVRAWNRIKGSYLEHLALLVSLGQYRLGANVPRQIELTAAISQLPLLRRSDGTAHFLWTQPNLPGIISGMKARPDLLIALAEAITPETVLTIRESKHKPLRAAVIRSEFGKAFDLRVRSYVIVSYYAVPQRTCEAAERLGLEVEALGLGDSEHTFDGTELSERLEVAFERADERSKFSEILQTAAEQSVSKELAVRRDQDSE